MIVYSNIPTVTDGGQQEAIVSDWDTQALLTDMLKELKKANLHNMIMTDTVIENTEVEV
jgi:hypothetical protein